jgi:glutathione S-transferase
MDLYVDPVTPTSRAILALCDAEKLAVNVKELSLAKGENRQPPFSELNPNQMVPLLVDDGLVLSESTAILRYLARKTGSRLYPASLDASARVDERMAWFQANLYRDFGFLYVYPQVIPHHRRQTDDANRLTIEWGRDRSVRWLEILDRHLLGPSRLHLVGDARTIADYFGAAMLSVGEIVGCSFQRWPNICRWYGAVAEEETWRRVQAPFSRMVEAQRGKVFVGLS